MEYHKHHRDAWHANQLSSMQDSAVYRNAAIYLLIIVRTIPRNFIDTRALTWHVRIYTEYRETFPFRCFPNWNVLHTQRAINVFSISSKSVIRFEVPLLYDRK